MSMDLKKLDPMARKMRTHVDEFYKALENSDGMSARSHIAEIMKYADYLNRDIDTVVLKQESRATGINDIYVGGVPVLKTEAVQAVHEVTTNILPGTIRTNRFGKLNRQHNNRTL